MLLKSKNRLLYQPTTLNCANYFNLNEQRFMALTTKASHIFLTKPNLSKPTQSINQQLRPQPEPHAQQIWLTDRDSFAMIFG